jgi:hypothetical protein
MTFFFQVDVPGDVPRFGGDHVLVFQCRTHADACLPPAAGRLPERYWDEPPPPNGPPFWRVLLHHHGGEAHADAEPDLVPHPLALRRIADSDARGWKLGGVPSWAQDPERYECACGTELAFLGQVPENHAFPTLAGGRARLFLGNEVYLLACPAHCHPAAVWPVNQN